MRVGDRVRYDSALTALRFTQGRVDQLQRMVTTGTRVERASDDPAAAASLARIRDSLAELTSYDRAIDDAQAYLGVGESAATSSSSVLLRAKALAAQAQNASLGPGSREAIASELDAVREQLLGLANTTYLDRPVFGGFGVTAFTKDPVTGTITFSGTDDPVLRKISPEETITVNVDGAEVFGFDQPAGDDVFAVLQRLATQVRAGSSPGVAAEATKLNARTQAVQNSLGTIGSRISRIETTQNVAEDRKLSLESRRSALEDVDLAAAATELAAANQAYQATLLSISRLDGMSLLDFLR